MKFVFALLASAVLGASTIVEYLPNGNIIMAGFLVSVGVFLFSLFIFLCFRDYKCPCKC